MTFPNCKIPTEQHVNLITRKHRVSAYLFYESVQGSLSVGYHCLSHSHGHLLCRVTNEEERKPPEYKSDRADEHEEGQK